MVNKKKMKHNFLQKFSNLNFSKKNKKRDEKRKKKGIKKEERKTQFPTTQHIFVLTLCF